MLPLWIRVANGGMVALLLYALAVQYNDPDPIPWMALYGAASLVAAIAAVRGRVWWLVPGVVAAIALAWASWWATGVIGQQPLFEEEGREMLGLGIAGGWMALDTAASRRFAA